MANNSSSNKRIAKNTMFLYFRTFLIMLVSLYTSRVVLNALGVEDYGIYNAVGGFVTLFAVISGALSNAISRYITYEIGKGDNARINTVFSTSLNIQFLLSFSIFVLCEVFGYWYLNYKMNIPLDRVYAANWVLHCSLLVFVINLISIPYNACIIAYEKMNAFAYISIIDAILKMSVALLIQLSSFDKLIIYSVLLVIVALVVRMLYMGYCRLFFKNIRYKFIYEKTIFWDLLKFAGWNFFTNTASIINSQGVTLLVNSYFGVLLNSARGIATQVDMAVKQFAQGFSTAINPQITKSYAQGDKERLFSLICNGARYSYFLILIVAIPVIFEAESLLQLWLVNVPNKSVIFVQLSIVGVMITITGNTGYVACMATGNIKQYSIWITIVGSLVFFITWISYTLGAPVEAAYVVYILVYIGVQITRLIIMKKLLDFPFILYIKKVVCKIILPTLASLILPIIIQTFSSSTNLISTILRFVTFAIFAIVSVYTLGLGINEKQIVKSKVMKIVKR